MFRSHYRRRAAEIPTAYLADMAFLPITFLLVTTTIDVNTGIGLTLPPFGGEVAVPRQNITNVWINAQGEVVVNEKLTQIPMIKEMIHRQLQQNPRLIISIKTARETRYETYIQVIDQIKIAGAKRISIAEPES